MSYYRPEPQPRRRSTGFSGLKLRLLVAAGIMLFAVVNYMNQSQTNLVTGEKQRISLTPQQEIELGLHALPEMVKQHGGYSQKERATIYVRRVGAKLLNALYHHLTDEGKKQPYPFDFHLLADNQTVNAFALPGGQVFITEALLAQMDHEGQLAGVLGHEIGHVLERHSAERVSRGGLVSQVSNAVGFAVGDSGSIQAARMVGNLINMKFGRDHELESDRWGVRLMVMIGYHPDRMIEVMDILEKASGGGGGPSFMSTHPKPTDRKRYIRQIVDEMFTPEQLEGLR